MTPIINPWTFYAMDMCGILKAGAIVLGVCTMVGVIAFFVLIVSEMDNYKPDEDAIKRNSAWMRKFAWVTVALFLIGMLTPSPATITKMILAQNVTYERVEMVGDTVKDVYEDIISLVDGNEADGEE